MKIIYCGLISIPHRLILADSNSDYYYDCKINLLINKIISEKNISNSLELDNKMYLNYVKHKDLLIYLSLSYDQINNERYQGFFSTFKDILIKEFKNIENVTPINPIRYCLEAKLQEPLKKLIKQFESQIYKSKSVINEINNDISSIKNEMSVMINQVVAKSDDLNELLVKCEKINVDALEMKNNAIVLEKETRCMKPWMWVVLVIGIIGFVAYCCLAITRCKSLLNAFC